MTFSKSLWLASMLRDGYTMEELSKYTWVDECNGMDVDDIQDYYVCEEWCTE